MPGTPSRSRRITGVAWRPTVLALGLVLAFAPLVPLYPTVGLDYSWIEGVSRARDIGAAWGTDIVYTIGPLGALYTSAYSPLHHTQVLVLGLVYVLTAGYGVFLLVVDRRWWVTVVAVSIATSGFVAMDTVFQVPPYVLAVWALTQRRTGLPESWRDRQFWQTVALTVPLGLMPLVKPSAVPTATLAVALCVVRFATQREWRRAGAVVLAPALVLVGTWVAVGQPLRALPDFIRTMRYTIGGYSQTMFQTGPVIYAGIFVVAAAAVSVIALLCAPEQCSRWDRIGLAAVTALATFIAFKSAFVRQESHAQTGAITLLVVALILATRVGLRPAVEVALIGGLTWSIVAHAESAVSFTALRGGLHKSWVTAPSDLADQVLFPDRLEDRYRRAQAVVRSDPGMPHLDGEGTVDLYNVQLAYLFAQNLDWSPRPSLQSFTAYTPELAALDREHLESAQRPDHLLIKMSTIDGRWAPLDDGGSWLTMAQWYDVNTMSGDYLQLDARDTARAIEYGESVTVSGRVGANLPIDTPVGWDGVVATIDLSPTLRGRLTTTAFRASEVQIEETLESGKTLTKRYLPSLGSVEVVVSPHINSAEALAHLIDPSFGHRAQLTTALRFTVDQKADWGSAVSVTYRPFRLS